MRPLTDYSPFHVVLKRQSGLKKISLRLQYDKKHILVKYPYLCREKTARTFLENHHAWIKEQIAHYQKMTANIKPGTLTILGKTYQLIFRDATRKNVWIEADCITVSAPSNKRQQTLIQWLKQQAHTYFAVQSKQIAQALNVSIQKISVRDTRSRWGSCSHKQELSFSWRLLFAPPTVAHYVCIHEVCHLREMNHSPAFWDLVKQFDPEYKTSKKWLKEYGFTLFTPKLNG